MRFKRYTKNPIIPRIPGTFHSIHAANPDLLLFNGKYHFYFRGQDEGAHDQLGLAFSDTNNFDGIHWKMFSGNPIIKVGKNESDFDSWHILDPASIIFNNKIYLYYSAHSLDKKQRFSIGLAISEDGVNFQKILENPVIKSAICPEVIYHKNKIYLFYQRLQESGFFKIYRSDSEDGVHFSNEVEVFAPSQKEGAFDKFSISTVRIWKENDWFYMTYGGCDKYFDYPIAFGLAHSKDLLSWDRYPDNPIFFRGAPGTWDEGAMWFATMHKINSTYFLWYEGVGTGLDQETEETREASRKSREDDYGGYRETSFSQIGLATCDSLPDW